MRSHKNRSKSIFCNKSSKLARFDDEKRAQQQKAGPGGHRFSLGNSDVFDVDTLKCVVFLRKSLETKK